MFYMRKGTKKMGLLQLVILCSARKLQVNRRVEGKRRMGVRFSISKIVSLHIVDTLHLYSAREGRAIVSLRL